MTPLEVADACVCVLLLTGQGYERYDDIVIWRYGEDFIPPFLKEVAKFHEPEDFRNPSPSRVLL